MTESITMRLQLPDGSSSPEFTPEQLRAMGSTLRETDADRDVKARTYKVTADELRDFVERIEELSARKSEIGDQVSLVFAEAKARGYDTKTIRRVIALRKRHPDDVAEENAVLELYLEAIGF